MLQAVYTFIKLLLTPTSQPHPLYTTLLTSLQHPNRSLHCPIIQPSLRHKVLSSTALQLVQLLNTRQATSVQILRILIDETLKVGVNLHLIVDQMFEQAMRKAEECDRVRLETGKENWTDGRKREECLPPFYGVPISVKESLRIKGKRNTIGYKACTNRVVDDNDGLFIAVVKQMGFIPFVRTNIPQGNKSFESHNYIYGRAQNPWNRARTPGGSSGGQAGLIASGGSVFGVGSDIGGSCRIPASFCGLFTLMSHRFSKQGDANYGQIESGLLNCRTSLCPITKSTEDIALFMNQIYRPENYERLGAIRDPYLGTIQVEKGTEDRIYEICEYIPGGYELSESGNQMYDTIVELPYQIKQSLIYYSSFLLADGDGSLVNQLQQNQKPSKEFEASSSLKKLPAFFKKFLAWMLKSSGETRIAELAKASAGMNVKEFLKCTSKFQKLKKKMFEFWVEQGIDVLIIPAFGVPAVKHTQSENLFYAMGYTLMWNLFQYPVGVVPVTLSSWNQEFYVDKYNDTITKAAKSTVENCRGMPIGVQIVGLPGSEETILRVMKELQGKIDFRSWHPYPVKTIRDRLE